MPIGTTSLAYTNSAPDQQSLYPDGQHTLAFYIKCVPPVGRPLLFLLYIDDLRSVVPEMVKVALFADDISLISSHHNKLVAEKELQRAVTAVAEWRTSKKWSPTPTNVK